MIILTRLNGKPFAINPDHVERIDVTPDTVVTMFEGTKYIVKESLGEVVERVASFRARVLALGADYDPDEPRPPLRLLPTED